MIDTKNLKQKLEEEKVRLQGELATVATSSTHLEGGSWNATPADREEAIDSRDEVADRLEDLEERQSIERNLEGRLKSINAALQNIEAGTYGTCKICGNEIEIERLEANPAAMTCKAHIDEE